MGNYFFNLLCLWYLRDAAGSQACEKFAPSSWPQHPRITGSHTTPLDTTTLHASRKIVGLFRDSGPELRLITGEPVGNP